MRGYLKKLGYWTVYGLFLLASVALINYFFFFKPAVKKLRATTNAPFARMNAASDPHQMKLRQVKYVDPNDMLVLGQAWNDKDSSFYLFPPEKADGMVRICALGDSFTDGGEVDRHHDYPTLLQGLFNEAGASNVEVLNFGVGGFGFQQTYMMWDRVARQFGCDFHLLGPRGFQAIRDTTFGRSAWSPYYVHARYILDGDDVKLIEVLGDTLGDRFDAYHRFLPPLRYLRYDRNPPLFLRAMLPKGRKINNPFYYDRRHEDEETADTTRILLGKMAASGSPILIGTHRHHPVDAAHAIDASWLSAAQFQEMITFPYVAQQTHAGCLGYELQARQYFNFLLDRSDEPLDVLVLEDLDWSQAETTTGPRRPLSSYSKVEIALGGLAIGQFNIVDFRSKDSMKTDAFVAISGHDEGVLDSAFVALDLELEAGMEVVLHVGPSDSPRDQTLARVAMVGQFNIGVAKVEGFEYVSYKDLERLAEGGEPWPEIRGRRLGRGLFFRGTQEVPVNSIQGERVTVSVHGTVVLAGEKGMLGNTPGVWFSPPKGLLRSPRTNGNGLPDLDQLASTGTIEIVAEHWEDGHVEATIASWKKTTIKMPEMQRPLTKTLTIGDDGIAVVNEL